MSTRNWKQIGRIMGIGLTSFCVPINIPMRAQQWIQTSAPITGWGGITCSRDGSKIAAVAPSGVYASLNAGMSWGRITSSSSGFFALAENGSLVEPATLPEEDLSSFVLSGDGSRMYVSGVSNVYFSVDLGKTWNPITPPDYPRYGFESLACSKDGATVMALGLPNVLLQWFQFWSSTNGGETWREMDGPFNSNSRGPMACSTDATRLVLALEWVGIFTSTNLGESWQQSDANGDTAWHSVACSADGKRMIAASETWSTDFIGGLYTSIDSGATWVAANMPATNYFGVACSADGLKLFAAVNRGGIYTWQVPPPPDPEVALNQGQIVVSWSASSAAVLQQSDDLAADNWGSVEITPVETNGQFQVIVPVTAKALFFRLKNP